MKNLEDEMKEHNKKTGTEPEMEILNLRREPRNISEVKRMAPMYPVLQKMLIRHYKRKKSN